MSKVYEFYYKGVITKANSHVIESLQTAFSITILQAECGDGTTHVPSDIPIPFYGETGPGLTLAADGTTEVYPSPGVEDYGDSTILFIAQSAATFGLKCGEPLISVAASSPTWVTITQDSTTAANHAVRARPQGIGITTTDHSVTVSYPLYTALKTDFSYKIVVTVTCVVNTFAPSKSSDTITFYFDGSTTTTFTLPAWSQTNTANTPNTECSYAETFTMSGATADTDKLTINNAARTLSWNLA